MERERQATGRGPAVAAIVLVLVGLPVLYLLSSGPVLLFHVSRESFNFMFYPVIQLADRVEWFRLAWQAYLRLWVP